MAQVDEEADEWHKAWRAAGEPVGWDRAEGCPDSVDRVGAANIPGELAGEGPAGGVRSYHEVAKVQEVACGPGRAIGIGEEVAIAVEGAEVCDSKTRSA